MMKPWGARCRRRGLVTVGTDTTGKPEINMWGSGGFASVEPTRAAVDTLIAALQELRKEIL